LPITLAIIKALIIFCAGRTYAIPITSVVESLILNLLISKPLKVKRSSTCGNRPCRFCGWNGSSGLTRIGIAPVISMWWWLVQLKSGWGLWWMICWGSRIL
jgi:hypothetical protein